jgi:hypothetical protein
MESRSSQERSSSTIGGQSTPVLSSVLSDGRMVELVYDGAEERTRLVVWNGGDWEFAESVTTIGEERLVPYSASNSLVKNRIVLFPSEPAEFASTEELVGELRSYLHRYVDLSESFERLAAYYALFTWVYDRFNELPYVRLRGDYGTGKTRFLLTLGSVCYKPIFASGASTVSPLFHMVDRFGGTLIVDEADFRFSDEKSDLVKMLNNGNVRGFPVLRTESKNGREFNPRAFQVFGPKIVGMRDQFEDPALESRFITERSDGRALRKDIPINLPAEQREQAQALRNKLLMFRFRRFGTIDATPGALDPGVEPRINQVYSPLSAVMEDEEARRDLRALARQNSARLKAERGASMNAQVLTVIRFLMERSEKGAIAIGEIGEVVNWAYSKEYDRPITNRWIGHVVRRKLNLMTHKSHGVFVIPVSERPKLEALFERYGVTREDAQGLDRQAVQVRELLGSDGVDLGDFGDVDTAPEQGQEGAEKG